MKNFIKITFVLLFLCSCKKEKTEKVSLELTDVKIDHAKGFKISNSKDYKKIVVSAPWPESSTSFTYLLVKKGTKIIPDIPHDKLIEIPIEKIVVTSTTHIPALEELGVEKTIVGFPGTDYISSKKTRKLIESGKIKELGLNESINTEVLIDLNPDLVVGFSIDSRNKAYETIGKTGIPVVYNGDWVEETPLGKAEWIKFFAPFFNKEEKADSIFSHIETEYLHAKTLANKATVKPTVFSGGMYKDIWYLPAGESWAASFFSDANTNYLWTDTPGTGSLSLSLESVFEKAQEADLWIGSSHYTSYNQLDAASNHHKNFKAYKDKKVYTFSLTKGSTGGLLYYELAPNRPDIVLKDIIHIAHSNLLEDYEPFFFKPLE